MSTLAKAPAVAAIRHRLAIFGWDIDALDVDVTRGTARIELRRAHVLVTFDARPTGVSTTRETVGRVEERRGRRGDRSRHERVAMTFLGRTRHADLREGLRWLSDYVSDNGVRPALTGRGGDVFMPLLALQEPTP